MISGRVVVIKGRPSHDIQHDTVIYTYKGQWVPGIALHVAGNMTDTQFDAARACLITLIEHLKMGIRRLPESHLILEHVKRKKQSI